MDEENSHDLDSVSFRQFERWETQPYTPLTFQLRQKDKCGNTCTCTCHTMRKSIQTLHTPHFLTTVIGYLFATYSGMPFLQPGCSDRTCRSYSARAFQATYRFPKWAFAAALHVAAGFSTLGRPTMTLFLQRRISLQDENGMMDLCIKGSVEELKNLFINRLVSPDDAESSFGHTPLHVRILF